MAKVIVPMLALLMLVSMASFVKADNKYIATVTEFPPSLTVKEVQGETMTTPSGVVQESGLELDFMTGFTLHVNGNNYPLYSYNLLDAVYNPKTQVEMWRSDAIWYMNPASFGGANGFAGNVETKFYGVPAAGAITKATSTETHCTLQGFGSFAGQTLVLSYAGPPAGTWTGFVIMH